MAKKKTLSTPTEHGVSGTQNYGGWITGEDYNAKLDGTVALKVYDEMRRSDAQVRASLLVLKLPLLSAKWTVTAAPDGDDTDAEIAAFCQAALLDDGAMEDTWRVVLEHILLMLDFGFSVLEKVYRVGDDGRIWFQRLAPRLPKTVERWEVEEATGKLTHVVQNATKNGRFGEFKIPAEYALVFIYQREGDNYFGQSVLRSAYAHWFYKKQAYRIDGVRLQRFGVGIPMAIIDDAIYASMKDNELSKIDATLKGLTSHEKAFIRTKKSVEWSILVPAVGAGAMTGLKEAVDHHNSMIARNVLASFMNEAPEGLNSNKTRTLTDFFSSALYALTDSIISTVNAQAIKPLCDLNFPMAGRRYPSLSVADVTDVDIKSLSENLTRLGIGKFITAEDTLEEYLRDLMGLPELPEELRGKPRTAPAPVPPAPGPEPPKPAPAQLRRDLSVTYQGRIYARMPTERENLIFSLAIIPDTLDAEAQTLAAALAEVRRTQLLTLATKIQEKDARETTAAFTDLRPDAFTIPERGKVEAAIKSTQTRVSAFGAQEVRLELQRQGAPIDLHASWLERAARTIKLATDPTAGATKKAAKAALTTSAKVTTERENDAWFNRILETAVRLRRTGLQGLELEQAIIDALLPEIDSGLDRTAKGKVNEAFSLGRAAEASALSDEIDLVEYSALLDSNTCVNCQALDGQQFAYDSPKYHETLPPYQFCEGNKGQADACRCVHLFLYKGRRDRVT